MWIAHSADGSGGWASIVAANRPAVQQKKLAPGKGKVQSVQRNQQALRAQQAAMRQHQMSQQQLKHNLHRLLKR